MYTAHFKLTEAPFSVTPDPRYLYMSDGHREALAHLLYGIGEGGGFVQLTGEVGTGKTTLCRCLLEQLPPGVDVALILNPKLTDVELLAAVCDELRIAYPPGTTSRKLLVDALYQHLLEAHSKARRTVLILDEAQDLAPDVLEQIRLLTNLETSKQKLLQVILIGQPELIRLLDREDLRQLAQRITARYHLLPFSADDTAAYVRHRMSVAGQKDRVFTAGAERQVHRASRGVPRLINAICDRALLGAYVEDDTKVGARIVRRAVREVLGRPRARRSARRWHWAVTVVAVALAAGGALAAGERIKPAALQLAHATWSRLGPASPRVATVAPGAPRRDGDAPSLPALGSIRAAATPEVHLPFALRPDSRAPIPEALTALADLKAPSAEVKPPADAPPAPPVKPVAELPPAAPIKSALEAKPAPPVKSATAEAPAAAPVKSASEAKPLASPGKSATVEVPAAAPVKSAPEVKPPALAGKSATAEVPASAPVKSAPEVKPPAPPGKSATAEVPAAAPVKSALEAKPPAPPIKSTAELPVPAPVDTAPELKPPVPPVKSAIVEVHPAAPVKSAPEVKPPAPPVKSTAEVPVPAPVDTASELKPPAPPIKSAIAEVKPAASTAKPAPAESAPSPVKSATAEVKPAASTAKPAPAESAPSPVKSATAEVKPAASTAKPAPAESAPSPVKSATAEVKPAASTAKPAPVESGPSPPPAKSATAEVKPAAATAKPASAESAPSPPPAKSATADAKPASIAAKPTADVKPPSAQLAPPSPASRPTSEVALATGEARPSTEAKPLAAEVKPPAPGSLGELLANPAVRADKGSAFASLYARWGLDFELSKHILGCERGRSEGLRCMFGIGSFAKLRRIGLPAILELGPRNAGRRYATLVALDDETATLDVGGRRLSFPLAEVTSHWDGSFILLWRAPAVAVQALEPGKRGADVAWVRERLSEIDGTPVDEKNRDLFDSELRARVIAFQRSRALVPDGIVGEETFVHLSFTPRDAALPRIVNAGS